MKESLTSPYNKCIFRETFNSEQAVRNNGGVPTDVTISKGIGSFNGKMMRCQVYDGILDLEQLTQIWSSTRNKIQ